MDVDIKLVDIILAVILLLFAIMGWVRGLAKELFSIVILFLTLLLWSNYQEKIVGFFANYIGNRSWLTVVAFTTIFLASLFASLLIDVLISRLATGRRELLAFFGLLIGTYRGLMICSAIFWILVHQPFFPALHELRNSYLLPKIEKVTPFLSAKSLVGDAEQLFLS